MFSNNDPSVQQFLTALSSPATSTISPVNCNSVKCEFFNIGDNSSSGTSSDNYSSSTSTASDEAQFSTDSSDTSDSEAGGPQNRYVETVGNVFQNSDKYV